MLAKAMVALQEAVPPRGSFDKVAAGIAAACLLLLYVPTVLHLNERVWSTVEQSYGPVLLAAALWLAWQRREALIQLPNASAPVAGFTLLAIGLLVHALGSSMESPVLESGSAMPNVIALLLLLRGWPAVRAMLLPLAVLLFAIPLPADIVAALTAPLKSAVSAVAASILATAGYPIARTGVVLMIGPYQLLVADACAGLTSMFTLEAIGLVYMGLRGHESARRNLILGLLLVPIAFIANVVRVLILVLVTYYFGDEAGQGFVHNAAGILLFVMATGLMLGADAILGLFELDRKKAAA